MSYEKAHNLCFSISWEYNPEEIVLSVDSYEKTRPPRRTHFEMVLPRDIRQSMLKKEWEVPQSQIAAAVRNNIKIKNQRRTTVNNLGKATKMEEMMENAGKKVMRGLLFRKSTSKQLAELDEQYKISMSGSSEEFEEEDRSTDETKEDPAQEATQ